MSAVAALASFPSQFESGTTVRFTQGHGSYPATAWTAKLLLNNGVDPATIIDGTANGSGFNYVIPASPALKPGVYQWAEYFTAIAPTTEKARGATGRVEVTPNLAETATPSEAQAMVTLLTGALKQFATTTTASFSFSGQSFSRASIGEYQRQLTYWQSRVIAENRRAGALRGEDVSGRVRTEFARPYCSGRTW